MRNFLRVIIVLSLCSGLFSDSVSAFVPAASSPLTTSFTEQALVPSMTRFIGPLVVSATIVVTSALMFAAKKYPVAVPSVIGLGGYGVAAVSMLLSKKISPRKLGMMMPFLGPIPFLIEGIAGVTAWISAPALFAFSLALISNGLQSIVFWIIRLRSYRNFSNRSKSIFISIFNTWRYLQIGFASIAVYWSIGHPPALSIGEDLLESGIIIATLWISGIIFMGAETIAHEIYVLGGKKYITKGSKKLGGYIGREIFKLRKDLRNSQKRLAAA